MVVNMAWPGYQISDKVSAYREYGYRLDPEIVILETDVKDFKNRSKVKRRTEEILTSEYGAVRGGNNSESWKNVTMENMKRAKIKAAKEFNKNVTREYRREEFRSEFARLERNITESQEVWVVDHNPDIPVFPERKNLRERFASRHQYNYLDWEGFYKPEANKSAAFLSNSHPSKLGHRLWARKLVQELESGRYLKFRDSSAHNRPEVGSS